VLSTFASTFNLRRYTVGDRELGHFWLSGSWFGKSVLSADPQQECWTGMHRMLVPYFVVMLLAYAVGYPAAVFVVLRRASNTKVPSRPFPSLPFPSLPFPSLPFPSLPFPSLPFPSLPFPSLPLCSTAHLLCSAVFCLSCPDLFYCAPFLSVIFVMLWSVMF